jgi:hypothetical protein
MVTPAKTSSPSTLEPDDPTPQLKNPVPGQGFLLARQVGIEPTTIRLTVGRSTAELLPTTALEGANGSLAWGVWC